MPLKIKQYCPCGCGVWGVGRERWKMHVKGCPCSMCQRQFPPARAPQSLRDTAANIAYLRVKEQRSVDASGKCEAHGFHTSDCDGYGREAHHVLPRSKGGQDDYLNLRWIHPSCHQRIHSDPAAAKAVGLLEDAPASDPEEAA